LGEGLNGLAATRTRRRGRVAGVDAHGKAVAQAGLGCGQKEGGHGRVGQRGGVRARHGEGDGGCGVRRRRVRLLHKNGTAAGRVGVPRVRYGRVLGIAGSRGERREAAVVRLTGGLKKKAFGAAERCGRRVGAVQGARLRRCRRTGVGAEMLRVASVSSSSGSSPPPPPLSLSRVRRQRKENRGAGG
jgi:hypothetical protein